MPSSPQAEAMAPSTAISQANSMSIGPPRRTGSRDTAWLQRLEVVGERVGWRIPRQRQFKSQPLVKGPRAPVGLVRIIRMESHHEEILQPLLPQLAFDRADQSPPEAPP